MIEYLKNSAEATLLYCYWKIKSKLFKKNL